MNRLTVGGPIHHVAYLTRYLEDEYETLLVVGNFEPSEGDGTYILEAHGVQYTKLSDLERSINPLKDVQAYKKLRQLIREFRPDIVHTHGAKSGFLGRLAAISEKVPVILHTFHGHVFHSYFNKVTTNFFIFLERYLAAHSSKIIAISELQRQELVNRFKVAPEEKIVVIPLGFDLSAFRTDREGKRKIFRNKYNLTDSEIAVGIVGRLTKIKNQKFFLNVATTVKKRTNKKVKFFIIGDGSSMGSLQKTCKLLGLKYATNQDFNSASFEYDVVFTSWIRKMDEAYAGLDIVTLTSLNEGTPVTLIEAQSACKPVISTEVGGVKDAVLVDKSALLSPSGDLEAFVRNLINVIEDEDLRKRMSLQGDEIYHRYNYKRLIKDIKALYLNLLSIKPSFKTLKSPASETIQNALVKGKTG